MIAHVRIDDDGPLMTSEDLEGTARVYRLLPHIVEHACLGDAGETFRDAMGDTELAHLLEHVTVELLAQRSTAPTRSSLPAPTTCWLPPRSRVAFGSWIGPTRAVAIPSPT